MLFSSLSFLLYFLPPVVLIHLFLPKRLQNPFLFFASLFFYAWGDARFVPLFFGLLVVDWGCGVLLDKTEKPGTRKCLLALGVFQLGIPYVLLAHASGWCPPLICALLGALEPLLNPVWVAIFDGELPGLPALIGGLIVIIAVTALCIHDAREEAGA